MTTPTWGLAIPGYSTPSTKQKRLFDRLYPGAAADFCENALREQNRLSLERQKIVAAEKSAQAICNHRMVPTGLGTAHVCTNCRMWVQEYAT
jgi:hypothetical protein